MIENISLLIRTDMGIPEKYFSFLHTGKTVS